MAEDDDRSFDPMAQSVGESDDRLGFDQVTNHVDTALGMLVPHGVARRAVTASIETDRDTYRAGEPVAIDIEFRNRLPVPVTLRTPSRRLWTWTFDGHPEARRERRYLGDVPGELSFRSRERKRITRRWDGLVKRKDKREWVEPVRGDHEIAAYVALDGSPRPEATTTVRIE
jgi:hypothetical protein